MGKGEKRYLEHCLIVCVIECIALSERFRLESFEHTVCVVEDHAGFDRLWGRALRIYAG